MSPKIVYYGTPEFACAGFEALIQAGYRVVAAVTAPDRPAGRGLKPRYSALKQMALEKGIPVLQPEKLKSEEFLTQLRELQPDLQVVVAFRKLPPQVWALPPMGTFNLHASLLPAYRGAAPINWAIINGETQTGVSTFFINDKIDEGNIIAQKTAPIYSDDNFGTLHDRLMELGAELIVQTVRAIVGGRVQPIEQPQDANSPQAPKIFKPDCQINPQKTAKQLYDFVRGLAPYPAAWIDFYGKTLKVFAARISQKTPSQNDKDLFFSDGKTFLALKTADSALELLEVQLEGRNKMTIEEFLRGFKWENRYL